MPSRHIIEFGFTKPLLTSNMRFRHWSQQADITRRIRYEAATRALCVTGFPAVTITSAGRAWGLSWCHLNPPRSWGAKAYEIIKLDDVVFRALFDAHSERQKLREESVALSWAASGGEDMGR